MELLELGTLGKALCFVDQDLDDADAVAVAGHLQEAFVGDCQLLEEVG